MGSRGARATIAGPETPATGACPVVGKSIGSRSESSWLPRPGRPNGAGRAVGEHVLDAPARPSGEPPLALVEMDELRRTVIRMIARRAAVILNEMGNGTQGPKG